MAAVVIFSGIVVHTRRSSVDRRVDTEILFPHGGADEHGIVQFIRHPLGVFVFVRVGECIIFVFDDDALLWLGQVVKILCYGSVQSK